MTHTDRPDQITDILKMVDSEFPDAMGDSLETYISSLEANQQTLPGSNETSLRDPAWRYWQEMKRQQNRRERALRKRNNYQ